jgi:hypothetical protein
MIRIKKLSKTVYRIEYLTEKNNKKICIPLFTVDKIRYKGKFFYKSDHNSRIWGTLKDVKKYALQVYCLEHNIIERSI